MAKPEKILATELLDRDVLDLAAGEVVGQIVDFALTSDGRVLQIGVLTTAWYEGGRGIPPQAVANVHYDRVCIEDSSVLAPFKPDGESSFSLKGDCLFGKQVLLHDGELLGDLADFSFDLTAGLIGDLIVRGAEDKRSKVPVAKIRTIGRDFIVIDRGILGTEDALAAAPGPVAEQEPAAGAEPAGAAETGKAESDTAAPPRAKSAAKPAADYSGDTANGALFGDDQPALELSKFEEKKREYLLGRKAHRDIKTPAGELLAAKGHKLNEEIVTKIIAAGMLGDVFIEMTLKK